MDTPFEFVNLKKIQPVTESKIVFDFFERSIKLIFFIQSFLFKCEISFGNIDQLISFEISNKSLINVYIPCKRVPFVFTAAQVDSSNLQNLDENYVDWKRSSLNGIGSTFKLKFVEADHINCVFKNLRHLKGVKTLFFSGVKNRDITYTIEDFYNEMNLADFDLIYMLKCFTSQNEYLIDGMLFILLFVGSNVLSLNKIQFTLYQKYTSISSIQVF